MDLNILFHACLVYKSGQSKKLPTEVQTKLNNLGNKNVTTNMKRLSMSGNRHDEDNKVSCFLYEAGFPLRFIKLMEKDFLQLHSMYAN